MKLEILNSNKKVLPIVVGILLFMVFILPLILSGNHTSTNESFDKSVREIKVLPISSEKAPHQIDNSVINSQAKVSQIDSDKHTTMPSHTADEARNSIDHQTHNDELTSHAGESNAIASQAVAHGVSTHHETQVHDEMQQTNKSPTNEEAIMDRACYQLGPVKDDVQKSELETLLRSHGMMVTLNFKDVKKDLGYWVFLPPQRSVAIGRLKVEEIKLKGIKDVNLLVNHEPKLAISLGIFRDEKNAYQRMLKAQSLGFDAKMDIRNMEENQMWFSVESQRHNDLSEQEWSDLIKQHSPIELQSINCP